MTHTALCRHTGKKSLGESHEVFSVLVRNRTASDQTDLCAEFRRTFLLTTGSENVFCEPSSPVVREGGARETWHQLSLRTEPRTVRYNVVMCPMRQRVNFEDWESFLCFVRKTAANIN